VTILLLNLRVLLKKLSLKNSQNRF